MTDKTGILIRDLRIKHNLTQQEFGQRIGVGPTTISNYERGYSSITPKRLKLVAKVFGLKYSYFFDDDVFTEKILQNGVVVNSIPFYKNTNTNGILLNEHKIADSFISLPSDIALNTEELFCTNVCDNSMANMGIRTNSYVIVNRITPYVTGNPVLIHDVSHNRFIVRKYISDGPLVMFVSEGFDGEDNTIYTSKNDKDYIIIGLVEKAIIAL